ncbi:amino acid transporter [Sclerotinia borealis F-4128]|uniref:Amino acid transporter n=1 Tax=Sclerotinia borealis (strain F-4128) TaxID=1432307 RepID=W9CSU9_SCLBF|nr:amino acid transporter [Sclerotinia borealis F-4128]
MASYQNAGGPSGSGSESSRGSRRKSSRTIKEQNLPHGQASWFSSNVNLLNTIVGAGTLAMPLAMSHMGILLGTFVIVWSGLMAAFGLYLQSRCARYLDRGTASFFALSQITYPNAAVIFDAAIAIKCFGVGVSYLIIIGDLMPGVATGFNQGAESIPLLMDRKFWVTVFMFVVIPLSYLRRLDSLKYTSIVALVSIGYLVILVVYHFFKGDTMADRGPIRGVEWGGIVPTLQSFPVIVFAYTCHQNMFSILNEIKDNSPKRTTGVVVASIGSAASIYVLVAITGYLSFGNAVKGNIVGMYIPSTASTIAKAAIVILVMFSYPLQVHPCRASVDAVLKWRPNSWQRRHSPNGSPARSAPLLSGGYVRPATRNETISETRFAIITTVIITLSYFTAITVSSLDKVLAYVGSTGSTSISFILPGLFYYKISSPDSIHHQRLTKEDDETDSDEEQEEGQGLLGQSIKKTVPWRKTILRKLSLALAIYGICVLVICLTTNLFFTAQGH